VPELESIIPSVSHRVADDGKGRWIIRFATALDSAGRSR